MSPEKYPRTYHFPFSEGAVNDDKICQHWAPILSQELVITEKLDGENTCIKTAGVFARSGITATIDRTLLNQAFRSFEKSVLFRKLGFSAGEFS